MRQKKREVEEKERIKRNERERKLDRGHRGKVIRDFCLAHNVMAQT